MTLEKGYLSFDPVAGDYDWTRYLPPEAQEQAARLLREEAGLSEGQILLDAGTGTGRFSLPLARLGVPVIGLDVSEKMLSQQRLKVAQDAAGEALPLRVARADLRALPLGSGAVGAALMVHILHLIADWKRVLAEIRRALAPGGVLLLAQEGGARQFPTRRFYTELARDRGLDRTRIGSQSVEETVAYLRAQGARVERVDRDRVQWRLRTPVAKTIEALRRRSWSGLWTVPEEENAELVARTEAWARQTYGSLEGFEESEAQLIAWAARWPSV
ncbi:MAG TPA: methyltransferase domain-containing protein [Chthonomonadaceae bacterium]|nr:methyltransferase domain-containing protein [Chthonomonadaceae bacterium]